MTNWFSVHRSIKNHWLFEEERKYSRFEAWFYILMETNHKDGFTPVGNQVVTVKRGQMFTSKLKLSEKFNWSRKKLDAFFSMLKRDNMIHIKSTTKYTLITVVNYDFYQSDKGRKAQQTIQQEQQQREQQPHNNRTTTAQQPHTYNKDNKENKGNKENKSTPPSRKNQSTNSNHFEKTNTEDLLNQYDIHQTKLGNQDRMDLFKIHHQIGDKYLIRYIEKAKAQNKPTANYVLGIARGETKNGKLTFDDLERGNSNQDHSDPFESLEAITEEDIYGT